MPKTTKKKEVKKDIKLEEQVANTKPESGDEKNVNNCAYHLTLSFNADTFNCWTNDLKIGILSFKPVELHTEGYIKIEKDNAVWERKYPLIKMRQLFNDPQTMELFLANLMLG